MDHTTYANNILRCEDQTMRVLLVESDASMQRTIQSYLKEKDIHTLVAFDRSTMLRHLAAEQVNLMILDPRLDRENGLNLLREVRSHSNVPIIVTTDSERDEIDRVVSLELGADDYLAKPFSLRELLARIHAVLRRTDGTPSGRFRNSSPQSKRGGYRFSGWQLDRRTRQLTDPNGSHLVLTKMEYTLLLAFLQTPRRPLTREQLLRATRMYEDIFDRSIDVQILRLRRKLQRDPTTPHMIQTERGVGYIFTMPVEAL